MARRRDGDRFVGRRWAVDRIADWLTTDTFALVVTGAPGTGKTALAEALATGHCAPTHTPDVHAVHLCRCHVSSSTDPIRALAHIAGQLTRTVPGYQVLPHRSSRGLPGSCGDPAQLAVRLILDSTTPSAAYDSALSMPFERLAARRGRRRRSAGVRNAEAVVVIDGLDELAIGPSTAGLVDLFADRLAMPVPGLRLLLTSRPGPALDRLAPSLLFDLVANCPAADDDVREFLDAAGVLPARVRPRVAETAGGCYLYADVVMGLATTDAGVAATDDLPPGLDALYDRVLAHVGDRGSLPRLVLSVLARARDEGLTVEQVAGLIGAHRSDVERAVRRSRQLLTGHRRIRPHHRCLSERLWADTPDPTTLDWMIACHFGEPGWGRPGVRPDPYALRHLWVHLADVAANGGAIPARRAMSDSAADAEYVTSALLGVGVDDLLSALSYVERRVHPLDRDVVDLTRVLRRQAMTLRLAQERQDEALICQQLVYEATTMGASGLARSFGQQTPDSAILTLWATNDNRMRNLPAAFQGHARQVTSVVVTADGTRGFTTSKDRTARIWRLASGRLVHALHSRTAVSNMYAARDTPHVVTATTDGGAQIWDADLGAPVAEVEGRPTRRVTAFATNDTGTVGVGGDLDGHATVWDLTVGVPLMRLPCPTGLITAVAITADARTAATATLPGVVTVWDLTSGVSIARLPDCVYVNALALSPAADRLLVGGGDGIAAYALSEDEPPRLLARLLTSYSVTAVAVNSAMPMYALFGAAFGQVGYIRLPGYRPSLDSV